MPLRTTAMGRRMLARVLLAGLAATFLAAAGLAAAGCGGQPASPASPLAATEANGAIGAGAAGAVGAAGALGSPAPEKRDIVVATIPGVGAAGLYIARDDGLFRQAGLNVTIKALATPAALVAAILQGHADVASDQYTAYINADAQRRAPIRILAAGYSLGARVQQIMVAPRSKIATVPGLKGATIAVDAVKSETTDLLYTLLATYGIAPSQVHVVSVPFPAMPGELAAGKVGAIYEIEPYVTEAAEQAGDMELADIDTGAASGLPIDGYGVLASWSARYPGTARAFARAILRANVIAATSPGQLQRALNSALRLNPNVGDVMATGTFPTATNAAQLQRVANLMLRYGQLSRPFSVRKITGP
jgi:NitT/TauT family transport system substrate-binding protein